MNSFIEVIKCSQKIGDRRSELGFYFGFGDVCICLGNFGEGEEYIKKVLRFIKEIGDKYNEVMSYGSLGFCYMCCG